MRVCVLASGSKGNALVVQSGGMAAVSMTFARYFREITGTAANETAAEILIRFDGRASSMEVAYSQAATFEGQDPVLPPAGTSGPAIPGTLTVEVRSHTVRVG